MLRVPLRRAPLGTPGVGAPPIAVLGTIAFAILAVLVMYLIGRHLIPGEADLIWRGGR